LDVSGGVFFSFLALSVFGICTGIFSSSGVLFLLVRVLLLVCEVRVQEDHAVVHDFEELAQEVQVTVKLPEQGVDVLVVDLNNERFGALLMLGLDDQIVSNRLINFNVIQPVSEICFSSEKHFLLDHLAGLVTKSRRLRAHTSPCAVTAASIASFLVKSLV
jgi:hypothetical protein